MSTRALARQPLSERRPRRDWPAPVPARVAARIDFVLPVHDEERSLAASVRRLHDHLDAELPFAWRIVIADNASTDDTPRIAAALAAGLPRVEVLRLAQKGRGRALRVRRELISRAYNRLLRLVLRARFSDAQCGFKAIRADVARRLLPCVRDEAWFFDTELLVLAQRAGLRIHEVPVDWVEDPCSSVDIARTARDDLRGVGRLLVRRRPARRRAAGLLRPGTSV